MKCKLFCSFFLLLPILIFAQDKKIYLDSLHMETTMGKHKYYRIVKDYYADPIKKIYRITDYYNSDKIEMTGTSDSKEYLGREGQFVYYYENGNKKSSVYYKNYTESGHYSEWYENGNPKLEGEYITDPNDKHKSDLQVLEYWDSNNVLKATGGNGDYEEIIEDETGAGKIKNGFKDGIWTGSNKKIKYSFTETYANQKLVSGVSIDSNKVEHSYKIVFIPAQPEKGVDDFRRYIGRNFQVPEVLNLSGKIITTFDVNIDGTLTNFTIIKSIGYGTDEEMLRVMKKYNQIWQPMIKRGIKVKMTFTLPVGIQGY